MTAALKIANLDSTPLRECSEVVQRLCKAFLGQFFAFDDHLSGQGTPLGYLLARRAFAVECLRNPLAPSFMFRALWAEVAWADTVSTTLNMLDDPRKGSSMTLGYSQILEVVVATAVMDSPKINAANLRMHLLKVAGVQGD